MQSYFVVAKNGDRFVLDPRDATHVRSVMRLRVGDQVVCVWQEVRHLATLSALDPPTARLVRVLPADPAPPCVFTAYVAVIKPGPFELVVQKLTELGVSRIVAVRCARSGPHAFNQERLARIAKEAAEQCGRATMPELSSAKALADLRPPEGGVGFFGAIGAPETPDAVLRGQAAFVIGPEGGFAPPEVETLARNGFRPLGLGPNVLRSETAAVAAAVVLGLFSRMAK